MKIEMLKHLDRKGNVIGEISRKEVHVVGAWHSSIHAYIINNKNEILLQLRTANKDIFPSVWDISVGGHVDANEESITTACREIKEELGVKVKKSELTYLCTNKEILKTGKNISREFVDIYLTIQDIDEGDITFQKEEVADVKFIKLEEFFNMVERKDDKLFPHYKEYKKVVPHLKQLLQK